MTPATLPAFLVVEGDQVQVGRAGQVTTRRRADGGIVASAPTGGAMAGAWELDGPRVLRDGRLITTLAATPGAAAVVGDALWVSVADGVYRVVVGDAPERIEREPSTMLVPVAGGVVRSSGGGYTRYDTHGERICGITSRVGAMVGGPAGELIVVSRDGLSVWDARCMRIGGAPLRGDALGFADDGRLLVVGLDQAIHELRWPSLVEARATPPAVDASWVVVEGPALRKGDWVYDPRAGSFSTASADVPRVVPDLEALLTPDGGRLRLAAVGPRYAVHAAAGPAQVFEIGTLRAVGVPLTPWFEQVALSADGRLLVGIVQGEACAVEVATGRRLWAVPVERDDRVEVYGHFVALVGSRVRRLLDPRDGAERWTIRQEEARPRRREDEVVIRAGDLEWRSDGPMVPLPWTATMPELAGPAVGPAIARAP